MIYLLVYDYLLLYYYLIVHNYYIPMYIHRGLSYILRRFDPEKTLMNGNRRSEERSITITLYTCCIRLVIHPFQYEVIRFNAADPLNDTDVAL